jgi:hypothetical protein
VAKKKSSPQPQDKPLVPAAKRVKIILKDTLVIYRSQEDGCWIAHSLRTDQVGVGDRIVVALADAIKAVHQVSDLAAGDSTIRLRREAPPDVQEMARRAKPLPREIYEIAHKMVHGQWPEYLHTDIKPQDDVDSFEIAIDEDCSISSHPLNPR